MSTRHTINTCKRCGETEMSPPHNGPENWFSENDWTSVTLTPSKLHSRVEIFAELCPACSASFRNWLDVVVAKFDLGGTP